jgi:hypothetical protein
MDNPKKKKQDRKLVATKQSWEVATIQKKWKITKKQLIEIVAKVGHGRKAIEKYLEEMEWPKKEFKDQKFKTIPARKKVVDNR